MPATPSTPSSLLATVARLLLLPLRASGGPPPPPSLSVLPAPIKRLEVPAHESPAPDPVTPAAAAICRAFTGSSGDHWVPGPSVRVAGPSHPRARHAGISTAAGILLLCSRQSHATTLLPPSRVAFPAKFATTTPLSVDSFGGQLHHDPALLPRQSSWLVDRQEEPAAARQELFSREGE